MRADLSAAMRSALIVLALSVLALPAFAQERTVQMREALVNLARVMGESHALRQACEGGGDQYWRARMTRLVDAEQGEPVLDEDMKDAFNAGFAETKRLYSGCGESTRRAQGLAAARGREIALGLSQAKYRVITVLPPQSEQGVTAEPSTR